MQSSQSHRPKSRFAHSLCILLPPPPHPPTNPTPTHTLPSCASRLLTRPLPNAQLSNKSAAPTFAAPSGAMMLELPEAVPPKAAVTTTIVASVW